MPLGELVGEMVPQPGEQPVGGVPCVSVQLTMGGVEGSFDTVAVKLCAPLTITFAALGATETVMAAAVTVIVAVAVFVESVTDVAVSVTCGGLGTAAGAV